MSTSYSEISDTAALEANYEKMDLAEDGEEFERNRPDSLFIDNMECNY
jgi:hypothetical protein